MDSTQRGSRSGAEDDEAHSIQELEPSPADESPPDFESDVYFPKVQNTGAPAQDPLDIFISKLGLSGHGWDHWLIALQKYSTYPPSIIFLALHFANTSLIPLVTRSLSSSESSLLLTRPMYQSPSLERAILTVPILIHVVSGVTLRSIRARRRARLYGAETRIQRSLIRSWPSSSLQAKLGYALVPLLGTHVLIARAVPLFLEGDSSGVGLGYIAHGIARNPVFWNTFYASLVVVGVWHTVGGWAVWMGWKVATSRTQRRRNHKAYLEPIRSKEATLKKRRTRWIVHGISALGTSLWLAGSLGVVGRWGRGSGWEADNWDELYRNVPVIGGWL